MLSGIQHSRRNFTFQTVAHDISHFCHACKIAETKFSPISHIFQVQELNPSVVQTEDELQLSNKFDIETCVILLSVVIILTFLIKGLRKKGYYNKRSGKEYIAGGMIFGTIFGLFIVPGLYVVFDFLADKMQLIETKEKQLSTVVAIYNSLGGGWK